MPALALVAFVLVMCCLALALASSSEVVKLYYSLVCSCGL
jgi:hypothetical protein